MRTETGVTSPAQPASQPHRISPDVESFYHLSSGALTGKACNGTACFVARHLNPQRSDEAEKQHPQVYCLGQCFAAPAVAVGRARPRVAIRSREGIVLSRLVSGNARTLKAYTALGGYRALEKALTLAPEQIMQAVELSGLRGRGGAGFSTGRKWRAVLEQRAGPKYVIANADEGDSGAYIDRYLMEDDPFALLEGLTIAAQATGASQGWIYIRAEAPRAAEVLRAALAEARRAGLLGPRILGRNFAFDIELHVGQGSYVCGEETALLNSLEGRRPEVRSRPPYPTEQGLWGQPTLVNNVETLVSVPWIVEHGGEAYRALGFSSSRGTKAVSLNSLFQRPGLYEIEFGVTVRHIVEELGGGLRNGAKLKGVVIGGPLAGLIPPDLLDTPFGFEELHAIGASVGHGGIIAFDEHTSIAALIHHVFAFGAYESCGKCTPCRLGSRRVEQVFADILRNRATNYWDEQECEKIISALKFTSLCGLGTGLAEFAESALRHYRKELELCLR
jgi:NADH:ubiquinone oxidoreductase subunit F (NADH-binding)